MAHGRKWVTMGDVAARAGVGKITVSRVIRTPGKVSADTRARVETAIAELGYVPDETAGALSSQRSRIVGALVSTLEESVFAATIDGLSRVLRAEGYQLLLGNTGYRPELEAGLVSALLGRRPDAIVLTSIDHTPEARALLQGAGLPVVELWELPPDPVDAAVGFSNHAAGAAITGHLIDTGRKRIGFIGPDRPQDTRGRLRREGYAAAVQRIAGQGIAGQGIAGQGMAGQGMAGQDGARIALVPPAVAGGAAHIGAAGLARMLDRWPDTDAVVCVSDAVALGAWCEAARRGLAVPRDLAITGFGDFDLASEAALGLTTVRIDGAAIGAKAAEMILTRTAGRDLPAEVIDMGFSVVRRSTT